MKLLIDNFLPQYQFSERHHTMVQAPLNRVYTSLTTCDMGRSKAIRTLFRLRGLPGAELTIEGLKYTGFQILGSVPNREVVIGLIGRFWKRSGDMVTIPPEDFSDFNTPGYAKAALNFTIEPLSGNRVRLVTETRIFCNTKASRNLFRAYWTVIRPFSGWIRMEMLRLLKLDSES